MSSEIILVTGAAGFIGSALSLRLLTEGHTVYGIDSINNYYDPHLKLDRLKRLQHHERFHFVKGDLIDAGLIESVFQKARPKYVVNLAAQVGVRYSLVNPQAYIDSNITGFLNILEACRRHQPEHLVYASSSSVYGLNAKLPFSVQDTVDHPISLYAATKKSNELMAHTYSHLFRIPTTGLRFFTVYGPWGRPDMAIYSFAKAIVEGRPIQIFNQGAMTRDFTFIDDIIQGLMKLIFKPTTPDHGTSAPYRIYNIGESQSVELLKVVNLLEQGLGRKAIRELLPMQPGDVLATYADVEDLERDVGYKATTPIEVGLEKFIAWFKTYHSV